jgi:hypothetical protein
MDKHLKKTRKVKLNRLGLERVNQGRRVRGLAPLDLPVAPDGQESVSEEADALATPAALPGPGGPLPAAVDNSALPSFPPVRNQGGIGSCASFSTTYYAATHMLGLARGFNNKNDADNSTKLSPKWTYPMVNGGQDSGSWFSPTFDVLIRHGGATWADWPYSGVNTPGSYREWCRDGAVWRRAVGNRMNESGVINDIDTDAGLSDLKTLLANGYVLLYATDIFGWQYTSISDDPSTTDDNPYVGKRICYYVAAEASGHAMTVVGYNDNLWCDVNKNGVVDPGEKGALRICNSWGATWLPGNAGPGDGGFTWLAYDALRAASAVPGASTPNRVPGSLGPGRTAWWYNQAYWLTARPAYTPTVLAQFTLTHAARSQMRVRLGTSATGAGAPTTYWTPGALQNQGGSFAFDGSFTSVSGTFVMDFSDIAVNGANSYYLSLSDFTTGSPAGVSDFRLTDALGNSLGLAQAGVPGNADNSTSLASLAFTLSPPSILNGGNVSGTVGLPFNFGLQASGNPTSFGASGLPPGIVINPTTGVLSGTPTRAGIFSASLSANSAGGSGAGSLAITINTTLVTPPVISSSTTAAGSVGADFTYTITASGSPTSFGATGLPSGVTVNPVTGIISGVPTQAGTFLVQLSANNAGGAGSRTLTLSIGSPPSGVPSITSALTDEARVGSLFTYRITADHNPTSFGADGLPEELVINPATGVITGTPTLARDHTITLRAANGVGSGYATLLLSVVGDSSFGPANDAFANRTLLTGTNVTATGGNNNATAEANEATHAGNTPSRSVWWTWTALTDGPASVSTVGSDFDTVLAVYTGTDLANLTSVAEDDDSGASHTSVASFTAVAGTAYAIAVDGFGGAVGNIALRVTAAGTATAPPNDNFAARTVLTGTAVTVAGQTIGATAQAGEPAHAGSAAAHSVWWTWTAPASGSVRVTTSGSDFDTVLGIYTGLAVNALTAVAADDQGGGNDTSAVTFQVTAGTAYQIAVDGYHGAAGHVVLSLQAGGGGGAPANDNFAGRTVLTGNSPSATGSNVAATSETGEPAHFGMPASHSLWWSWQAPASGLLVIDTAGSAFDTVLAVYTGLNLSTLVPVVGNDDAGGLLTSRISFPVTVGVAYRIALDGFGGSSGVYALHLQFVSGAPVNDLFANATVLTGPDPTAAGANINATIEPGEPRHAGFPTWPSVWWSWTAPASGTMTFSTSGSSIDTILAVYTGSSFDQPGYVGSNDDGPTDRTSSLSFWATAGVTYRIAVDGYLGATGNILLSGHLRPAGNVLYGTDFESFAYGADSLVGADGWEGFNSSPGVEGAVHAFPGLGLGGYLGYNAAAGNPASVYRPVAFDPIAQGRPIVTFATILAVIDSDNGLFDYFTFSFNSRAGQLMAAIIFDNSDLSIYYNNRDGLDHNTGWKFKNDVFDWLVVTVDFAANRWSARLGSAQLFTNQLFNATGVVRDLSDVSIDWYLPGYPLAGNNYVLFDNYSIAATSALAPPAITSQPQSRTNSAGTVANFSVSASSPGVLVYQWQFQGTNLPGATNASLTVLNVSSADAGSYRVEVRNEVGAVLSQPATLTVADSAALFRFDSPRYTSRGFEFRLRAGPGRSYLIETSTNLSQWTPLTSVTLDLGGSIVFLDSSATNRVRTFYRARPAE